MIRKPIEADPMQRTFHILGAPVSDPAQGAELARAEDAGPEAGAPSRGTVARWYGLWGTMVSVVVLSTGCKGWSVSQCVSPEVKGRVLDDQTHQPIADVQVQRVAAHPRRTNDSPPKGGQLMEKAPRIVLSAADGSFDLDGEYSVAAFQVITWNSVDVQFRRAGYLSLTTNFTPSMASANSSGRACVVAGDIFLKRDIAASGFPTSP